MKQYESYLPIRQGWSISTIFAERLLCDKRIDTRLSRFGIPPMLGCLPVVEALCALHDVPWHKVAARAGMGDHTL